MSWAKTVGVIMLFACVYVCLTTPWFNLVPRTWTLRVPPNKDARLLGDWYWSPTLEREERMLFRPDGTGKGIWGTVEWGADDDRLHLRIRGNHGWYGSSSHYEFSSDLNTLSFTTRIGAFPRTIRRKALMELRAIGTIKPGDVDEVLERLRHAEFEQLPSETKSVAMPLIVRVYQIEDARRVCVEILADFPNSIDMYKEPRVWARPAK